MPRCNKQHLRNIWDSIDQKIKQNWNWIEKCVDNKKVCITQLFVRLLHIQKKNVVARNTQSAQISTNQDEGNIIWIILICTTCPPGHHHNDFMGSDYFGHGTPLYRYIYLYLSIYLSIYLYLQKICKNRNIAASYKCIFVNFK